MKHISYKRHRFHSDIIKHAIWLYFRFTLSFRDIECLMAERGIDVSYESLHYWVEKFGLKYASTIRKRRRAVSPHWYLDEVFVSMGKQKYYLWRAVDDEGEVLDILVQKRRNKTAALKLLKKLIKHSKYKPKTITTDLLPSYGAALKGLGLIHIQRTGGRSNNRAESSHVPIRRRERKLQRFKSQKSAQRFLSAYGPIYNLFNYQRHLISRHTLKEFRTTAFKAWDLVTTAS
jgi:putative transposase